MFVYKEIFDKEMSVSVNLLFFISFIWYKIPLYVDIFILSC